MVLPLMKLGTLLVKTVSKPLASQLKHQAKVHPQFRQFIINFAQVIFLSHLHFRSEICWFRFLIMIFDYLRVFLYQKKNDMCWLLKMWRRGTTGSRHKYKEGYMGMPLMLRFVPWTRRRLFKLLLTLSESFSSLPYSLSLSQSKQLMWYSSFYGIVN